MSAETEPNPLYLMLKTSLLFKAAEVADWKHYEVRDGYIMVRALFFAGAAGIEGELGLCVPPKNHANLDDWEGSCRAGKWDCWAFLNLMTMPNPKGDRWKNGVLVAIFFGANTFFDCPLRVLRTLEIQNEDESGGLVFGSPGEQDKKSICDAARVLLPILTREFGAVVCDPPNDRKTENG